ncbi:L-xylulose/3-keto-L-gulonate kinase [Vibrio aerogenes CECT 7868]|uniref:L-xylulose/3-keto-L-gulonate kinase n=1 Tax=Vibrio aerogenes CECT 7868 TaxID=1216006 RepID=A0A1M5YCA0_9VIBR|nr:FGGY-family carbohydrate kinase [Vibrio aerogenes]SHI09647.1 L-xylulose/3-keto-L-gulonate kinase [Vibrio aerogenes CECT 7868]
MNYYLGIDSGGTMLKACLFDRHGQQVALYRENTSVICQQPGWVERDVEEYFHETCRAIRGVILQSGINPVQIKGLSISAQGKGLYLLDEQGHALRNGILSSDSRATEIVRQWQAKGIPEKIYPLTLQTLWTGHPVSLLRWIKLHEPGVYRRIGAIMMSHDYLRFRLTGRIQAEITNMSESNFFNATDKKYDPELLKIFEIEEVQNALPELIYPTDLSGNITRDIAEKTGLVAGTPVYGGLFDVVSTAVCSGINSDETSLNFVMGTWSVTSGITKCSDPESDERFVCGQYAIPGEYIVHEASPTSASNYEWFAPYLGANGHFNHVENEALVRELSPLEADILFVPFLYGSNAGLGLKASLYGVQAHHTKGHLIQAIWKGILFCHLVHLQKMLRRFPRIKRLRVSGGSTQCMTWMQMLADMTGLTLEIPVLEETGAMGAALVSMIGAGEYPDFSHALTASGTEVKVIQPNPELYAGYQAQFARYQRYISSLQQFETTV